MDFKLGFQFGFLAGMVVACLLMFYWTNPRTIEKRAKYLNLYRYDSKINDFVPRDSIKMSKDDFYYLQHGNFQELITR